MRVYYETTYYEIVLYACPFCGSVQPHRMRHIAER